MQEKLYHRRNLPHYYPREGTFFITYRLAGTLPIEILNSLREEYKKMKSDKEKGNKEDFDQKVFLKFDRLLDSAEFGPVYLKIPQAAEIAAGSLHFYDKNEYDLICYCIMPNHVHLVMTLLENARTVSKLMQSIKGFSANKINKSLEREGEFWQSESYDRVIRNNKELINTVSYVLENPVKAGLVDDWKEWPYTYLSPAWEGWL